jgi:AraC-like DNA-binding protein
MRLLVPRARPREGRCESTTRHGDVTARRIAAGAAGPGRPAGSGRSTRGADRARSRCARQRLRQEHRHVLPTSSRDRRYRDARARRAAADRQLVHVSRATGTGTARTPAGWSEVYLVFAGPVFDTALASGLLDLATPVRRLEPVSLWRDPHRPLPHPAPAPHGRPLRTTRSATCCGCWWRVASQDRCDRALPPRRRAARPSRRWRSAATWIAGSTRGGGRGGRLGYESWRKALRRRDRAAPGGTARGAASTPPRSCSAARRSPTGDRQAVGFSDEHHFARQFRAVTGLSTTAYRRTVG